MPYVSIEHPALEIFLIVGHWQDVSDAMDTISKMALLGDPMDTFVKLLAWPLKLLLFSCHWDKMVGDIMGTIIKMSWDAVDIIANVLGNVVDTIAKL